MTFYKTKVTFPNPSPSPNHSLTWCILRKGGIQVIQDCSDANNVMPIVMDADETTGSSPATHNVLMRQSEGLVLDTLDRQPWKHWEEQVIDRRLES